MSYDTGLSMEERVSSLFQPDTLLPEQYLDTFRRKLQLEPEKKLMLAILEDAIACYQKAIALDPKLAVAHNGLGAALFNKGQLDEALATVRKRIPERRAKPKMLRAAQKVPQGQTSP